jgi:5-methylcytosine-specific restriction endonuclease McrA
MKSWSRSQLANHEVIRTATARIAHDHVTTAELLADPGELDARKLYLSEGYASMHAYCVGVHNMSEDVAYKRARAAETARRFPAIFDAVAEGRLNLGGVLLLRPHLAPETAEELIAAASRRTREEIERLLAERCPKPDVPTRVEEISPGVGLLAADDGASDSCGLAPGPVCMTTAQHTVDAAAPRAKVTPLAPQRFKVEVTLDGDAHRDLVQAQALLGREVARGDVAEVLKRSLHEYVLRLQRRKCAATDRPRPCSRRRSSNPRHVPAAVRRAVWERDGGLCTFVIEKGYRCEERSGLELDHVIPVARRGEATEANLRLRCRAHNQHAADRAFGRGFMDEKRSEAQRQAAEAKAQKAAAVAAGARERAAAEAELAAASDVIPGLKILGYRGDDLRHAAHLCAAIPNASTKERMHCAIKGLGRANMSRFTHAPRSPV